MAYQTVNEGLGPHIPNADLVVFAAAGQEAPVGAKGEGKNPAGGVFELAIAIAGFEIPQVDGAVGAAGQGLVVGAKGHRPAPAVLGVQGEHGLGIANPPQVNFVADVAGGQQLTIGAKGDRQHLAKGVFKHRSRQVGLGKVGLVQGAVWQVGLPNGLVGKIPALEGRFLPGSAG
jgi:hypothetical protein